MAIRCEDIIRRSLNRNMTEEEVLAMEREARQLAAQARAGRNAAGQFFDIHAAAEKRAMSSRLELMGRERAVELQLAAVRRGKEFMYDHFKGMEWEGISAMMVGSKFVAEGARDSVDALASSLKNHYVGGMINDIEALGSAEWRIFQNHSMDRQIMEALFSLDNKDGPAYKGPAEAMSIAKAIHKWAETARVQENMAGAWIRKLPGYIMRQNHDPYKMHKAGFEAWRDEMLNRLDWEKTADGKYDPVGDRDAAVQFLESVYNALVTGIHEKKGAYQDPLTVARVTGSVAARASHHRVLHFASGLDYYEYNLKFGKGHLCDGVIAGLSNAAGDIALMRMFGPSPEAGLETLIHDLELTYKARMDVESLKKLRSFKPRLYNQMKELDGSLNIEGNPTLAEWGRNIRAVESMAKLGQAVISGFSDIPLMAQEMAYQGRPFFRSLWEGLTTFYKGKGSQEERRILSQCGVFFDSMIGDLTARWGGNDGGGRLQWLMNRFFKYNGLSWWSDAWKRSATLMMSHDLALERHLAWDALSRERRRVLSLYRIDSQLWDMMRTGKMAAADGREFFTPEAANLISATEIKNYMQDRGMLINDDRIAAFRTEIGDRLRSYFKDRVQYAVLEPDARTAAIIHQGQSSGTATGEALRFCMQFKSFPAVFLHRTFGREIYGRGADAWLKGLRQAFPGGEEQSGMLCMIAATTLFGCLSMMTKQAIAGKIPRDPTESWESFGKVLVASLVQGGGMGIFGDFLFGAKSRVGDDFLSTLAGPTMSTAGSLVSLYKSARDGEDVSSNLVRTLFSHLPGNNIWYVMPVMNHMLMHSLYEAMNPGYMTRLRKRVKEDTNQGFFWEPTVWDWAKR